MAIVSIFRQYEITIHVQFEWDPGPFPLNNVHPIFFFALLHVLPYFEIMIIKEKTVIYFSIYQPFPKPNDSCNTGLYM